MIPEADKENQLRMLRNSMGDCVRRHRLAGGDEKKEGGTLGRKCGVPRVPMRQ